MSVFKYYLNTKLLMMVFKYLPRVIKYLTTVYVNHPVKKIYALSLITVHILGLRDLVELLEDQRHMYKNSDSLQYMVETQISENLTTESIYGTD